MSMLTNDFGASFALLIILAVLWRGDVIRTQSLFLRRILLALPVSFLAVTIGMCVQLAFRTNLYLVGGIFVLAAIPACYFHIRGNSASEPLAT